MSDEPTLGEVMRQVRALVDQVRDLVQEVRSDYVRKEVYEARHAHINRRVDDAEKDISDVKHDLDEKERERKSFQRQIVAGVLIGLIVMLAQIVITALLFTGGFK